MSAAEVHADSVKAVNCSIVALTRVVDPVRKGGEMLHTHLPSDLERERPFDPIWPSS
jgi:hypothetical protein